METATTMINQATADDILKRQHSRESNSRTYARNFRMVPQRAQGMLIEGADGSTYLDCLSGAGSLALGHNHPVVVEAMTRTIERGVPLQSLDIATNEKDDFIQAIYTTSLRTAA